MPLPPGWAEACDRFGRQVVIELEKQNFEGARAAIDRAERAAQEIIGGGFSGQPIERPLASLDGLDVRLCNALETLGILTVGQALETPVSVVLGIPNVGEKALRRLRKVLNDYARRHGLRQLAKPRREQVTVES